MLGFPSRVPFSLALTEAATNWLSCGYAAAASTTLSLAVSAFWDRAEQPGPNGPEGLGDGLRAWLCVATPPNIRGTARAVAVAAFAVRAPVDLMTYRLSVER
ncbi:hypothetical protein ACE1SV_65080 [Streptomyces sennicomposti]